MATITRKTDISPETLGEIESALEQDLRDCWFPRVIDPDGGFVERFDCEWHPMGDRARHLFHQARLTWTAAAYASHNPEACAEFSRYALHGIEYIDAALRDRRHGGFYYDIGLDGQPLRDGEKHACAIACAIFAAARVYAVTMDERARAIACDAFDWLEEHSRRDGDSYVEDLTREGSPIVSRVERNPLGHNYGDATSNTHIHLLEAYSELYRASPTANVRAALESLFRFVRDRFVTSDGHLLFRLKNTARKTRRQHVRELFGAPPMTTFHSHGHAVETAYLLMDAASALGTLDDAEALVVATHLAEVGLSEGLDRRYGGQLDEPDRDKGIKIWWVQAEALNTWSMMDHYQPASGKWATAFEGQWSFICDHLIDRKFGGWVSQTTRRGRPTGTTAKSDEWLDPYHTGRALMNVTSEWRHI